MAIMKNCRICDKGFTVKAYRVDTALYCSATCRRESMRGRPNTAAMRRTQIRCANCGIDFEVPNSQAAARACSKTCADRLRGHLRPEATIRGDSVLIPLGQERFATVDIADAANVLAHTWTQSGPYATAMINGQPVRLHVFIMASSASLLVDHKNGNALDCRRDNMRRATYHQSACNQRSRGGSSRYKGVSFERRRDRWTAEITSQGVSAYLGAFVDEDSAARAYDAAARRLHGDFACVNFPIVGERGALQGNENIE